MPLSVSYEGLVDTEYTLEDLFHGVMDWANERGYRTELSFAQCESGVRVWLDDRYGPIPLLFNNRSRLDRLVLQGSVATRFTGGKDDDPFHENVMEFLNLISKKYFHGLLYIKDEAEHM